jgi:hypothetical protein
MSDIVWDGVTRTGWLGPEHEALREALGKLRVAGEWDAVIKMVRMDRSLANAITLDDDRHRAPLHDVALAGAPRVVARVLVRLGAWRTLRDANGDRPLDVADRAGHVDLLHVLEPTLRHGPDAEVLAEIEAQFHVLIRSRAAVQVDEHGLRLPQLSVLRELAEPKMYFPVPGAAGGFSYWLDHIAQASVLVSESWSRTVADSGQRHIVSRYGAAKLEDGFV